VLDNQLLVHIQLQQLKPRLVLLCADSLQPHEHTNPVDNRRLTKPRQPFYRRLHRRLHRLGLLLLPRIRLCHGLFNARYQLRPLHADQIRQLLRPLQPRVHLVTLTRLDSVLRPRFDIRPRYSHLLAYLRLRCVAV
jgi:hypothetical protein